MNPFNWLLIPLGKILTALERIEQNQKLNRLHFDERLDKIEAKLLALGVQLDRIEEALTPPEAAHLIVEVGPVEEQQI